MRTSWRIGIDIGGTFTDVSAVDDTGAVTLWKEDSTHPNPEIGVQRGLTALAEQFGLTLGELLSQTRLMVHGSTIATNTVIERTGPTVGLVCTEGFRDVLLLRDGFKWDRFNVRLARPADFVDRHRRLGVHERIGHDGTVIKPLVDADVRNVVKRLVDLGAEVIAVALLWSNVNPVHERRVREIISEEFPRIQVMLSCDVLPETGEWVRTSATVLSAYIYERSAVYLRELGEWLRSNGLDTEMLVMQVNGGCASVEQTIRVPAGILISGPAAAPAAGRRVGRRIDASDMLVIDMGGTSLDVCLLRDGQPTLSRDIRIDHQPIGVQGVEVHSIGAGGGSIAWIDSGQALRVGPRSAGADPGPAAYGRGGEHPTVTDANLVLGYIDPERFLGGRRALDLIGATRAVQRFIAEPLGLDVVEAAASVYAIVNGNMVDAIRLVAAKNGVDLRTMALVAGGGAGPVHAARLAADLGVGQVLIPAEAGTICSYGMTATDVRHDYSKTMPMSSTAPDLDGVAQLFAELEAQASMDLRSSGFEPAQIRITRSVDARYRGQFHDVTVPVASGRVSVGILDAVEADFHKAHEVLYRWCRRGHAIDMLQWRVTGIGTIIGHDEEHRLTDLEHVDGDAGRTGSRLAHFVEFDGLVETKTYDRAKLADGMTIDGPALIDSATTTIVVPPDHTAIADRFGNLLIDTGVIGHLSKPILRQERDVP